MEDLLTFTSEIKQINSMNTYFHLIKNLASKFLKKAESLLTLPACQISLYEVYEISNHSHDSCGNHGAHHAFLSCTVVVSIPADNPVHKTFPNVCDAFCISAEHR
jgi:hypothetical protein